MQTGQNFKKLNNEGFTLVELVVVIAILVILTSGMAMSSKVVGNANVSQVVSGISTNLARTQQLCMTKQVGYMSLYMGDTGWTVEIDGPTLKDHRVEPIGSAAVWVHIYYDNGYDEELMDKKLVFSFTSSGSLKKCIIEEDRTKPPVNFKKNAQGTNPETYTYDVNYDSDEKYVTKIEVINSGGKKSEIVIHPNTGHVEKR